MPRVLVIDGTSKSPTDFPASQTILTTQLWDTKEATAGGVGNDAYVRKNSMAVLNLETEATSITVDVVGTGSQGFIGVFVDGVYTAKYQPAALDSTRRTITISGLPARMKTVELWEGPQSYVGAGPDVRGCFFISVTGRCRIVSQQKASRRLVVYADSIATTGATAGVQDAWVALTRPVYPGRVSLEAWEGRAFVRDDATPATLAQRLVDLLFDADHRQIWLAIGTNDYSLGSAPTFGTNYALLLDAIRAIDQRVRIWCQSPFPRNAEVTATMDDGYRTPIRTAALARSSYCTYVHGPDVLVLGDMGDGLHPSVAGHVKYAAAVRTALSF